MISFVALLLAAAPASEPTYLQCTFPKNGAIVDITADEQNSAVTISLAATGYTDKFPAAFTPTEVRFQGRDIGYVIDRTDLSVRRTIKLLNSTDFGACLVQKVGKRAF